MLPKLQQIELKSGEVVKVSPGVTAIVGPNNAGKSLLLNEIIRVLSQPLGQEMVPPLRVVDRVDRESMGDAAAVGQWLEERYQKRGPGQYSGKGHIGESHFLLRNGAVVTESQVQHAIQSESSMGPLFPAFALHLGAEGRLGVAGSTSSIFNLLTEQPTNPVQHLYKDRELESQISSMMVQAFGQPLTVNRYGGSQITVHVGSVATEETRPPVSDEYLRELSLLPQLQEQGDGIRAFIGILLSIATTRYPLIVIDEPEAFLHPPQAYQLGKLLAEQHHNESQVLVATHSQDVLQGLTSAKPVSSGVTIARLTRSEPTVNHVHQVPAETISELYQDPLVKYYGILNGLFYQGTVLCEADSDCTYYRAVLDSIELLGDGKPASAVSLHFTHCGGKDRLPKAVKALLAANVPVVCVVDFDFLQEDKDFNALITAFGGDPEALSPRRNDVVSAVRSKAKKIRRGAAKVDVNQILDAKATDELSSGELTRLFKALKASSGWQEAKLHGRGLLSGQALTSFETLNLELRQLGIFIVEVGELERFHREIPAANKAVWLRKVLEQELHLQSPEARSFIMAMVSSILSRQ